VTFNVVLWSFVCNIVDISYPIMSEWCSDIGFAISFSVGNSTVVLPLLRFFEEVIPFLGTEVEHQGKHRSRSVGHLGTRPLESHPKAKT
jgi:hypothetical protein